MWPTGARRGGKKAQKATCNAWYVLRAWVVIPCKKSNASTGSKWEPKGPLKKQVNNKNLDHYRKPDLILSQGVVKNCVLVQVECPN